jgi:predicted PhzF superfamily epimerase YddE/YHI9
MNYTIYQVDAFTDRPFTGNPAGVCILQAPAEEPWMRNVAAEMNLSETAFLSPEPDGFRLRWFTPTVEVPLCGHATLASSHILWETGRLGFDDTARFHTLSGVLTAEKRGPEIEMNFPLRPIEETPPPPDLGKALGARPLWVGRSAMNLLVELDSEKTVRDLEPNMHTLARLPAKGVIVTSRSERPEFDFVSRYFAPAQGVNEDPVTGSAHCTLGPFWEARLGKSSMVGYQASARGGIVKVRVVGDRVLLGGSAVTVLKAELIGCTS